MQKQYDMFKVQILKNLEICTIEKKHLKCLEVISPREIHLRYMNRLILLLFAIGPLYFKKEVKDCAHLSTVFKMFDKHCSKCFIM